MHTRYHLTAMTKALGKHQGISTHGKYYSKDLLCADTVITCLEESKVELGVF